MPRPVRYFRPVRRHLSRQGAQAGKAAAQPALKPEELDRLLAPVALYPDQLLAQMLLCASNPGKVAALNEWLASHQTLKGSELQDAATKSGFEPSFVALVLFPQVVSRDGGAAGLDDAARAGVCGGPLGGVRQHPAAASEGQDAGKLKTTPQQEVETRTTSSGQQVIVIEPANPQVVYVPQYNAQTVYTQPTSSTVVVQEDSDSDAAVAAGLIGFTAGIAIGAAIDNDYYYGPYGWHGGAYMYNDGWDDWYDHREDARDDWQDHREDLVDERGDRREDLADERGDRARTHAAAAHRAAADAAGESPESQAQREQRRTEAQSAAQARPSGTSQEARGYSRDTSQTTRERSGTRSDAFSGYSSGRSERAASSRGERSRSSSRGGGGRRR